MLMPHEVQVAEAAILAAMNGTTIRAGQVMGPAGCVGHGAIRLRRPDGLAMVAAPIQALVGHGPEDLGRCPDLAIAALVADAGTAATDDILAVLLKRRRES
jgi:hypothetical protein